MMLSSGPVVPANAIHLPLVGGGGDGPAAAAEDYIAAELSLFQLVAEHAGQQRTRLTWDNDLHRVARLRCADMRAAQRLSHVDVDGRGPNWWLRAGGVTLPDWYGQGDGDNNVESLALNRLDAAAVLALWLASPHHRDHILGEGWFGGQSRCGVGVGPDWYSPMQQYVWCFLSCH